MGVDVRTIIGCTANVDIINSALEHIHTNIKPDIDDFNDNLSDYEIRHSDMSGNDYWIITLKSMYEEEGIVELEEMDDSAILKRIEDIKKHIAKWETDPAMIEALSYLMTIMYKYGRLAILTYYS